MAAIPVDILFTYILPNLPAKSLLHFKCVCKSWHTYISSPDFISLHLHHSRSSNTNHDLFILTSADRFLHSFSPHMSHFGPTKLLLSPVIGGEPFVIGSCFGLLCVHAYKQASKDLIVINSLTGICRQIPCPRLPRAPSAINFGFGYDHVNDDFKVVRVLDYCRGRLFLRDLSRQVSVFSFKANAWRVVEWGVASDSMKDHENGALINDHLLHWKVWCFVQRRYQIRCFELCQEKWVCDVPLPDCCSGTASDAPFNDLVIQESDMSKRDFVLDFGVFNGCLFLSTKNEQQSDTTIGTVAIDVWFMKAYGVQESWTKLFHISDTRVSRSLRLTPVAWRNGQQEILVKGDYKTDHELFWYSITDGTVEKAEFHGAADCFWVDLCKGSLVNVPGGYQIRAAEHQENII